MLSKLRREYCEYIPRFLIVIPRNATRDMTFTSGLTNQLCFAHIFKTNGGQDKREVDSCIGKHVGPLERGQIKCGDVEVENSISTS